MSVGKENTKAELEDIKFKIESALINCFNHLQWEFSGCVLKGFSDDVGNKYIYEYHPHSDKTQVIRLVFKEKIEPEIDTVESIQEKFDRVDHIRLTFPNMSSDNLPSNWLFSAEKNNVRMAPSSELVFSPYLFDKNGLLKMSLTVENIKIYGKNKQTGEEIPIDLERPGNGMIQLDLTIQNSD